jgi:uncharacterized protein YggE
MSLNLLVPTSFLIIILNLMIVTPTTWAADNEKRYITVTGHGKISAIPDTAWLSSGVYTQAKTATEALNNNNNLMEAVIEVLKDANIKNKNIQTSGFNVYPIYDHSKGSGHRKPNSPKITGYRVSNSVTIKIINTDKLGKLLDKLVGSGSNQISGVRLGFNDSQELLDEARKLAIIDAEKKAKLYAKTAGIDVGNIISISELGARLPRPVYRHTEMRQAKLMSDAGTVPVASGEQDISASVNVVYELMIRDD